MNCKQGDLAVIVNSIHQKNIGVLVNVLEPYGDGISWYIERVSGAPFASGLFRAGQYDYNLRPIRDNDGTDETLAWAGKPQEVTA